MFKPKNTKHWIAMLGLSLLVVSGLPLLSVQAQGSACAPGYARRPGASESEGCLPIIRDNPGGSQGCESYTDTPRSVTPDGKSCAAIFYCQDNSIPAATKASNGCGGEVTNPGAPAGISPDNGQPTVGTVGKLTGDCKEDKINAQNCGIIAYLATISNVLSAIVGVVVVIMIAIGGIQYSAARDNPQATQAARAKIAQAVLALVIYIFIFAFLQWIIPGGVL